nr:zinc finger, CCHC-type [Tanacetum cinerariifolium]
MAAAAIKHMASSFAKLEKFEGVDFRRWQKKMHFMLSSMSVVYVLTTPMLEDGGENPNLEQVRKRAKWDNDDYVCRGLILNGMFDSLFDIYQNVATSKELWDTLEAKDMAEDASNKSVWSDQEKRIQKIDHLARSLLIQGLPNDSYSLIDSNMTVKDLWDALARYMLGFEYEWKQYATMMRQNKNLMDINIDALYNILKQNRGDVNDAMGSKKKTVVVTYDPLALIAEKMKVSKSKEKVVVSSDSEGSEADDFSELKKITALLEKAFNRRKFYSKPTNNNLRTSSTSQSANKEQEFVKNDNKKVKKKDDEKKRDMRRVKCYNCKKEGHFAKDCKKVKVKDYEYYKTKMLLAKKDKDEQVLLAEDQAWMESSSDSNQEINANMVFMAQIKKDLSDSEVRSSFANEKISAVSYYLSESESEYEFETLEYYDNSTNYGLFVNNDDDQENFHDAIEYAIENFIDNHINSQKDYDNHLRFEESLIAQDNDKPKGNNVVGPSVVNMVEHNNSPRYNDHKGKCKHHDTRANPNKKPKV